MKQFILSFMLTALLIPFEGNGQTAVEKARKVLSTFEKSEHLYLEAQIAMYENGSNQAKDTLSFVFQRNKQQVYFRMGEMEMLVSGGKVLVADHAENIVSITTEKDIAALDNFFDPAEITGLIKAPETDVTEGTTGDEMGGLRITSRATPTQAIFIKYDKNTYKLREIQVTAPDPLPDDPEKDPPIITLIARYSTIQENIRSFSYSINTYVVRKNGKYIGSGKCKGYEILSE